ncbi:MAG TPA: tetratricopeptide repeat protein [Burkholderiales bacterium]|nr:tetratricopeptide repeat protein [Burkholderiales bacterium]
MSLLLEALKKAERAKEEALRKGARQDAPAGSAPRTELSIEADPPAPERKHVVTRSELPDIHQPLEILSDDIGPATRATPSEPKPPSGAPRAAPASESAAPANERAAARKVFEVKYKEPNPRLPFYITMGVLGVAAVGIVVYFWYQLQPPSMLVNPNPPAGAVAEAPAPNVAPAQQPAPVAPTPAPSATPGVLAGLPGVPAAVTPKEPAPAPEKPAARGPKPSAIPVDPRPVRAQRPATPLQGAPASARAPSAEPQLTFARPAPQVHPRVDAAYAAYMAGDLASARAGYEAALRDEPANRDALLGLAAIDVRQGRHEFAEAAYLRLLRADPRDAHAQAGLIGLRGGRIDPVAAETRVKNLLATDPGAHVLQFSLGNQLAQQGRWPEAQQAYFKAYSADPEHPDFAFNLAVSLDHLRQHRLARQYYERAVALASKRAPAFDADAVRERIKQLPQ